MSYTTFWDGRTQANKERCPKCGEMGYMDIAYAPDVGRNWYSCNSESGCGHRWV